MENKNCQNCKQEFSIEPDDFGFYEKIRVPPPTFCPECRLIRRLAWRNEKSLYRNECKKCGNSIISVYSKDSGVQVYCRPCWWGDGWDGADYAVDFDETKSFISQLNNLLHRAPAPSLFGLYATLVNSEYTNMVSDLKNCYMITHSDLDENCMYGNCLVNCKDSVDNTMLDNSELCYENVNCQKCYQTVYSVDCATCRNVYFSQNCVDCSDCFGCVNLRSAKYHIWNVSYSKEEYQEKLKEFKINSYKNIEEIKKQAIEFWKKFPKKYAHEKQNSNISGDYIYNSKNTHNSFIVADTEDSKYCSFITASGKTSNAYDFTHFGIHSELLYESLLAGYVSNIKFCFFATLQTNDSEYCMLSTALKNCFGCIGLKNKQYCILNKQYTKEEYEELVLKIKKHMDAVPYVDKQGLIYKYGEFFPIEISPFGYNTTTAQELFPLTKEESLSKGYAWKDPENKDYKIDILPENLPDSIEEVDEEILSKVIGCEHKGLCSETCSTAFKIVPEEFKFYKRMNLPLPHFCSNCRHFQRNKFRNPFKLWKRICMCDKKHSHHEGQCNIEFETSYSPERPEIVYCEKCYQQEVY
jgi:Zn ribbon nucleic-acid-binding protein